MSPPCHPVVICVKNMPLCGFRVILSFLRPVCAATFALSVPRCKPCMSKNEKEADEFLTWWPWRCDTISCDAKKVKMRIVELKNESQYQLNHLSWVPNSVCEWCIFWKSDFQVFSYAKITRCSISDIIFRVYTATAASFLPSPYTITPLNGRNIYNYQNFLQKMQCENNCLNWAA